MNYNNNEILFLFLLQAKLKGSQTNHQTAVRHQVQMVRSPEGNRAKRKMSLGHLFYFENAICDCVIFLEENKHVMNTYVSRVAKM